MAPAPRVAGTGARPELQRGGRARQVPPGPRAYAPPLAAPQGAAQGAARHTTLGRAQVRDGSLPPAPPRWLATLPSLAPRGKKTPNALDRLFTARLAPLQPHSIAVNLVTVSASSVRSLDASAVGRPRRLMIRRIHVAVRGLMFATKGAQQWRKTVSGGGGSSTPHAEPAVAGEEARASWGGRRRTRSRQPKRTCPLRWAQCHRCPPPSPHAPPPR